MLPNRVKAPAPRAERSGAPGVLHRRPAFQDTMLSFGGVLHSPHVSNISGAALLPRTIPTTPLRGASRPRSAALGSARRRSASLAVARLDSA